MFTRQDAEVMHRKIGKASMGYYLPITQFIEEYCENIQRPYYWEMIPQTGFNRHHPRTVIFGFKNTKGRITALRDGTIYSSI